MSIWSKKPVSIEAVQLDVKGGFNANHEDGFTLPKWLTAALASGEVSFRDDGHAVIKTLEDGPNGEAKHVADPGDWIIRGVKGELYFCKPDIFAMTYEQAGPAKESASELRHDKELEDVRAFHNKFDIINSGRVPTMLTRRKLQERFECMQEELNEFHAAVKTQNFEEQADALIDLVYFAKGTAVMMGLPWEELWDDVQRANISKVRGVTKRGHAVDVTKPFGWVKPQTGAILAKHGYNVYEFSNPVVDDAKCKDDNQEAANEKAASSPGMEKMFLTEQTEVAAHATESAVQTISDIIEEVQHNMGDTKGRLGRE